MASKAIARQSVFPIYVQNCDGVYAASCPQLDITCFGDKDIAAIQEVYAAARTNARSILVRRRKGQALSLREDKSLAPLAHKIASSRRIQNWFVIKQQG